MNIFIRYVIYEKSKTHDTIQIVHSSIIKIDIFFIKYNIAKSIVLINSIFFFFGTFKSVKILFEKHPISN